MGGGRQGFSLGTYTRLMGRIVTFHWARFMSPMRARFRCDGGLGNTALHWAAAKDQTAAVRFLLGRGADVTALNKNSSTALHSAAANGAGGVVLAVLAAAGADPEGKDDQGHTPRKTASRRGHHETAVRLEQLSGLTPSQRREWAELDSPNRRAVGGSPLPPLSPRQFVELQVMPAHLRSPAATPNTIAARELLRQAPCG